MRKACARELETIAVLLVIAVTVTGLVSETYAAYRYVETLRNAPHQRPAPWGPPVR